MKVEDYVGKLKELLDNPTYTETENIKSGYLSMCDFTKILKALVIETDLAYYEFNTEKVAKLQNQTIAVIQLSQSFNTEYSL